MEDAPSDIRISSLKKRCQRQALLSCLAEYFSKLTWPIGQGP